VFPVDATPADGALPAEPVIVARLRARDEDMFAALVDAWSPNMLRVARAYVADEHSAQDVVQETWLGVVRGIDGFAARSSLRTWTFGILINQAKTRGVRDARTVVTNMLTPTAEDLGPTVDPARMRGRFSVLPGHWRAYPPEWPSPEDEAVARETRQVLATALDRLPARQRIVVILRDVEGYSSREVCGILEVSAANERVLLHRGRAALRAAVEVYVTARRPVR